MIWKPIIITLLNAVIGCTCFYFINIIRRIYNFRCCQKPIFFSIITPGDLSLVLPKRILDGIIEMIYALDKIAPGTANDDTLLYGVEVKFYNMEVELDEHLESCHKGLYIIGDGSGVTHSLSHASASGVYVARQIAKGE